MRENEDRQAKAKTIEALQAEFDQKEKKANLMLRMLQGNNEEQREEAF